MGTPIIIACACGQASRLCSGGFAGSIQTDCPKCVVPTKVLGPSIGGQNQHQDCAKHPFMRSMACSVWASASSAAAIHASSSKWFHRWGSAMTCSMTRCWRLPRSKRFVVRRVAEGDLRIQWEATCQDACVAGALRVVFVSRTGRPQSNRAFRCSSGARVPGLHRPPAFSVRCRPS